MSVSGRELFVLFYCVGVWRCLLDGKAFEQFSPKFFIKIMKKILLLMVAIVCATMSFAQSQIATLSHGDQIQTFYGPSSFKSAMAAADHGDIVTLSSGQFVATNITKAVTLRGSGMLELNDSIGFHAPTIIQGALNISIADSVQNKLAIDGVKFDSTVSYQGTLKNPIFTKCNFYALTYYSGGSSIIQNAILINCRVRSSFNMYNNSTATCINSIVAIPWCYNSNVNTTFEFNNCILTNVDINSRYLSYSTFKNCYINYSSYKKSLPASCIVTNCYSSYTDAFKNSINPTNKVVAESNMFASYTGGTWDDSQKFALNDDAATKYLGEDGTQIGVYGGNMPYEERISMPYITKCNVAGKSTADGKLSVDIQVEAAQ